MSNYLFRACADFLSMGGYGQYIWGAYGVVLLAIVTEVAAARMRSRRAQATVMHARGLPFPTAPGSSKEVRP